jgi:hypothetical protein
MEAFEVDASWKWDVRSDRSLRSYVPVEPRSLELKPMNEHELISLNGASRPYQLWKRFKDLGMTFFSFSYLNIFLIP